MFTPDGEHHNIPGCEPQPPAKFVLEVALGSDMNTPEQVKRAVMDSLNQYGADHHGTLGPWAEQPGFPGGYIYSTESGRRAGEWRVTS